MKHPPYFLRPNKAVDRFSLIEAIRILSKLEDICQYTYYGLGGPYLEEFRLLYEFFPDIEMISLEGNEQTYKRQEFHRPCGNLQLKWIKTDQFIKQYDTNGGRSIFWLDYTALQSNYFDEFQMLLDKIDPKSMIKVTLPFDPKYYHEKVNSDDFRRKFGVFMPHPSADPPTTIPEFASFLQQMVRIATEKTMLGYPDFTFQPISSFYYTDITSVFTLTGVLWPLSDVARLRKEFSKWEFSNLHWKTPMNIDIPFLSTKERLFIERHLPCKGSSGDILRKALGYSIDQSEAMSKIKLKQYADFHRYMPYFMKGIP